MLIFTRYDETVKTVFLQSIQSFYINLQKTNNKHNILIFTETTLPNRILIQLNYIFDSVTLLKPKIILPEAATYNYTMRNIRMIEFLSNYKEYARVYVDPTLYFVSPIILSQESSIFYKQQYSQISTKLISLVENDNLYESLQTFKTGQFITSLTDSEFNYVVYNNFKINKILSQKMIINGSSLDESNIRELPEDIIALDIENLSKRNNSKVEKIINVNNQANLKFINELKKEKDKNSTYYTSIFNIPEYSNVLTKHANNNTIIYDKNSPLECIIVRPNEFNPFESVKKMILSKYSHLPEHNNTLVVLGYNTGFNINEYRKVYPNWKIVIYQLEQLYDNTSLWYNATSNLPIVRKRTAQIQQLLRDCDEIWDYDIDNINFLESEGFSNIKHMPLIWSESLVWPTKYTKNIDILFYGSVNDRRANYLEKLANHFKLVIFAPIVDCKKYKDHNFGKYMKPPVFGNQLMEYVLKSKIVINIHYYESKIQEQVRIFELLINDITVVSEVSKRNYFNNLIIEVESPNEMIKTIKNLLKNNTWRNTNISKQFKNNEHQTIKIGAAYNTFYGFDLIDYSLNSIRGHVDYIVLIHQTRGLNSQTELPGTSAKIKELLANNMIDEVIYMDPPSNSEDLRNFILEKRNTGLIKCKENNCDIIIPMDADELYDMSKFYPELVKMYNDSIDTLYSPIHTYYYDTKHWFNDTYYVPSAYRILSGREFKRTTSSVLVDPIRRMDEGSYRISEVPMHHYSYLKDSYINKINRSISFTHSKKQQDNIYAVLEHLKSWKKGQDALVFMNDLQNKGTVILSNVKLKTRDYYKQKLYRKNKK